MDKELRDKWVQELRSNYKDVSDSYCALGALVAVYEAHNPTPKYNVLSLWFRGLRDRFSAAWDGFKNPYREWGD